MKPKQASYKDVGSHAIPADNSFSLNLTTFREHSLVDKRVQIISRPFKSKLISDSGRVVEVEFVLVRFQGETVRITNNFKSIEFQ